MFFQSKLFRFLLALTAYLLFFIQWAIAYKLVWYANVPEETIYFKQVYQSPGFYVMYVYGFVPLFLIFLVLGIIYLVNGAPVNRHMHTWLAAVMSVSAIIVWHYSVVMKGYYHMGIMLCNLVLCIIAVYGFLPKRIVK
jgi:hypothetical protein